MNLATVGRLCWCYCGRSVDIYIWYIYHHLFFADLFVILGCLYSHAEGLSALVSGRTGQAVEPWVCVDAALGPTRPEADVSHHVTLQRVEKGLLVSTSRIPLCDFTCDMHAADPTYLIDICTVSSVTTETHGAWSTLPGAIGSTVAVHSAKAWVGETAI